MAVVAIKSATITNLDALTTGPAQNTAGEGGPGALVVVSDYVTAGSGDSATSTYRLARIPTVAKVKELWLWSAIATAGSGDIDVAHSDSTQDGTPPALQGLIPQISSADNKLFGAAQSLVLSSAWTDFMSKGSFTPAHMNLPLWKVLTTLGVTSFSADPGGYFDIMAKITTGVTTGGIVAARVVYCV